MSSAPSPFESPSKKVANDIQADDGTASMEKTKLYNAHVDVSGVDECKLIRKVDLRTIPWLTFLYLLCFLDRTSIGNAKLYNMEQDLHLTDSQYLACLTIFFVSYSLFEVPANIVLKRLRPSIWFSTIMVGWGIMMTLQGLVQNFGGLMAMRWLLGVMEAGFFPGVSYYLSCWYKHSEYGIRIAVFFSGATVSGAFGGLLAAGISNMDGVGGKPAWAWIFILEGLITVVAGAVSPWIIVDFPDNATFLTETERTVVIRRLQSDNQFSAVGEKLRCKDIKKSFTEWKTYIGMCVFGAVTMPVYALALFLPSIIKELGYKATPANLLTIPVYVAACIFTCIFGVLGDRYKCRGLFNLICLPIAVIGFIILLASRDAKLSYFAVFLAACGVFPCVSNIVSWVANNVEGSSKRSVSLAMTVTWGNVQGIVSSNIYRANQTPWYPIGHGIALMYVILGIIGTVILHYILKRENARRDRGERDEIIHGQEGGHATNGCFESIEEAKREKGDEWSGYRYTL